MADSIDFKSPACQFDGKAHKAGIFIVGDVDNPDSSKQLHVLAPWVEGAYSSDGKKAYTLAKGSVDLKRDVEDEDGANASLWKTAVNEVYEETGIDLRRIDYSDELKEKGYRKDEPSEGFYSDVAIESLLQTPVYAGALPSNRGYERGHVMYLVKVKGIGNLATHLKHRDHNDDMQSDSVSKTAQQYAEEIEFYTFDQLLPVLRSGIWDLDREGLQMEEPVRIFDDIEFKDGSGFYREDGKTLFEAIEEDYAERTDVKVPIETPDQMDAMYQATKSSDKRKVKECLKALRDFMNEKRLVNDAYGLKLGDKHMPLRYYQEGADIIPMQTYIDRMVGFAKDSELYRDTQFNPDVISFEKDGDEEIESVESSISMASMAYQVAKSLDSAREERAEYIEKNPDCHKPVETWPATVIDANSTLAADIAALEQQAPDVQRDRRCA